MSRCSSARSGESGAGRSDGGRRPSSCSSNGSYLVMASIRVLLFFFGMSKVVGLGGLLYVFFFFWGGREVFETFVD